MSKSRSFTPLKVGLTGGIASGKSTIANMFADLGAPVIDTDIIARDLVLPGQPALEEIRRRFGNDKIDQDGNLDRAAMREAIFADDRARHDLEAILHPRISAETRRQSKEADGPYQIIVVPLLVGSALRSFVDRILVVDCDEETQVKRLVARDAESVEQAQRILAAQASREQRLAIADDVIDNGESFAASNARVIQLDRMYRRLAAKRDLPDADSPESAGHQPR